LVQAAALSTWVLLRGLARESRHWAELPAQLRASGLEGEFVCADLPGCGVHAPLKVPASVPAMAEFVRADVISRGHTPPVRMIGLSLGAMVAVSWAQARPEEIDRLVLINTSMRPFSGPSKRLRIGAWPTLMRAAIDWRGRRAAEAAIHALTCERRDRYDTDLAVWIAIYRSAPVNRANALRQLWAASRFEAGRAAPACPTLILASKADRLVHPDCSRALAGSWGAAYREHRWAGHDLPHDDPLWLAEAIQRWENEIEAQTARS
jgi:pimeloyl-ACP methyl ester carboxylesterase